MTDIAEKAGLTSQNVFGGIDTKKYIIETTGNGVAIFDYDNDGWPDIFLVNGTRLEGFPAGKAPTNRLYRNNHDGTFTDVTAKAGVAAGTVDQAVRAFYEQKGWSRDYGLPGLSHRTGHGIGMDVHEAPYLVRNDTPPLQAGMCFSDEPGLYVPGEFGIRLEDCWYLSESGPKLFTPLARSIEQPV